jgi:hypothetical protein
MECMKRCIRLFILTLCLLGIAQPCPYFLANTIRLRPCANANEQAPCCCRDVKQCTNQTTNQQHPGQPSVRFLTLLQRVTEDYCSKAPQPHFSVCIVPVVSSSHNASSIVSRDALPSLTPVGREVLNLNLRI